MNSGKKFIGNREGLSLLERALKAEKSDSDAELFVLRAATLDEWTNQKAEHPENTSERNLTAHGGKIVPDVMTIQRFSELPGMEARVQKWTTAFRSFYGVAFEDVATRDIPPPIRLVFNRRASVCTLHIWQAHRNKERRLRILENADAIIRSWLDNDAGLFEEGSPVLELCDRIDEDWLLGCI
ncbi:hypothetical protein DTO027B5_7273 [Paecilomyces variotii]|nr:hypothetical protein DTO021C3_565 [Paecilomyces variotii]KAJ9328549.1 hypothetical protein DTO027B3_815 [Paecilomyces variotii]KAJ9330960.1 hypothetical protein DTO027B5_7273 [Paecilomyces variotii]KAJ9398522.1 hypothetical protein DTO282F9_4613 [Paecilomyces variotii]